MLPESVALPPQSVSLPASSKTVTEVTARLWRFPKIKDRLLRDLLEESVGLD